MGERRDAACSAGRKSKEGGGDGPRGLPAPDRVRQLQIILYWKAKSKPSYRFWSLYGEVQRADVLLAAWRRVKANGEQPESMEKPSRTSRRMPTPKRSGLKR
jgi:hypothetical protein